MVNRVGRCNYEKVCGSLGMCKDPREFCVRCTRYIPHESHLAEYSQNPDFTSDFSLTTVAVNTTVTQRS